MKKLVPQKLKNVYHLLNAVLANFWYGFPSRKIKVIGVTGTNGKTTTVQMITKILEKAGHKVAMSSTINFKLADKEWVNKSKFTTLSAWKIQKFIKDAVDAGCGYIVIETSSHSLDQNRVWGVDYDVAVITNVTREHLDYHLDMNDYRRAKKLLFERLRDNFKFLIFNFKIISNFLISKPKDEKKVAVVNLDIKNPEEFLEAKVDEVYGYAVETQNSKVKTQSYNSKLKAIIAKDVITGLDKTEFNVGGVNFNLSLIGEFNIENALAAVCVGLSQDIKLQAMADALAEIKKVPGRMDYVENNLGLKIIIDYALTPDSMEKLGQLMDKMKGANKLFWVFGSCGERDRGKRPIMGGIVSRYADYVIVTNEDPYGEDPVQIVNEVFEGVVGVKIQDARYKDANKSQIPNNKSQINSNVQNSNSKMVEGVNSWRIMDRREAIKKAIKMAKAGDVILVTGKGAEETMAVGNKIIPWNDRRVIESILKNSNNK